MFLPIVSFADGYGLSYGAQFTFADVLGKRSRIGVPLTWGAERRGGGGGGAQVHSAGRCRASRAGPGCVRREHPFFDVPDRRGEVWARAERALPLALRVGGGVRWSDVAFGGPSTPALDADDRLTASGVDLTLDTRDRSDLSAQRRLRARRLGAPRRSTPVRRAGATTLDGRGYRRPGRLVGAGGARAARPRRRAAAALRAVAARRAVVGARLPHRQLRRRSRRRGDRSSCGCRSRRRCASAKTGVAVFVDRGAVWSHGQTLTPTPIGSRATAPACSPSRRCSSSGSTWRTARAAARAPTSPPVYVLSGGGAAGGGAVQSQNVSQLCVSGAVPYCTDVIAS